MRCGCRRWRVWPLGKHQRGGGEFPDKLLLLIKLFGVVDDLKHSAPLAELTTPVVSWRVELQHGAGRLLGMLHCGGELVQGLHQPLDFRHGSI